MNNLKGIVAAVLLLTGNRILGQQLQQQDYKVDFHFKLISSGNSVEYSDFCKEFRIVSEENKHDVTPCDNKEIRVKDFYKGKTKIYNASGKVLYEDLVRKFIHGSDTMVLVLVTDLGKKLAFNIENLEIKPGKFAIHETELKEINYEKAEEDYYNYILRRFKSLGELTDNFEGSFYYIELNRLRDKYLVPGDDYESKTLEQLRSYRKKTKKRRS